RRDLAHFTRRTTIGELAASLAHELNQPLTGILTNAEAAQQFLHVTPLDRDELRSIMCDVIQDARRAGDVIKRLRDFLGKGEPKAMPLDLNALIQGVTKLVSSDAVIRNVTVRLELDPNLPLVTGDSVQLQQVVLNLMLNAMEAIGEGECAEHRPRRAELSRARRADARAERLRPPRGAGGTGPPPSRHLHHRPWRHSDGRAGHEGRRRGLPDEALRRRGPVPRGPPGAGPRVVGFPRLGSARAFMATPTALRVR